MGVSGSGKTAVGKRVAEELGRPFVDADDLHPASNKEKMAAGTPLSDEDRWPWLTILGTALKEHPEVVAACSALKRSYRDRLRASAPDFFFVHLVGEAELLAERLGTRMHEFMPGTLLHSQLDILEPLEPDEDGFTIDITPSLDEIVASIAGRLTE